MSGLRPAVPGEFFVRMVKQMGLAGDTGSLLKIGEVMGREVGAAGREFVKWQETTW
jgi:hypothetical protein